MRVRDDFPRADRGTDIDSGCACIGRETAGLGGPLKTGCLPTWQCWAARLLPHLRRIMRDETPHPVTRIEPNSCFFDGPRGTVRGKF